MNKEEIKKENYEIGVNIIKSFRKYKEKNKNQTIDYEKLLKENYDKRQSLNDRDTQIDIKPLKWYQKSIIIIKKMFHKNN